MNHVYVYSGIIATENRSVPFNGQMWRDDGQPLSEEDMVARFLTDAEKDGFVSGPARVQSFLYTDMGVLSDPDTGDRT